MENRIERLRTRIDELVRAAPRGELWFVDRHMFAVSNFAAMLARKRDLDPELATMIGLLHDIHTALTDSPADHAALGAREAGAVLDELGIVTEEERNTICTAVEHHSSKRAVHDPLSELIKDADVLSHFFCNPTLPPEGREKPRLQLLLAEFGMPPLQDG